MAVRTKKTLMIKDMEFADLAIELAQHLWVPTQISVFLNEIAKLQGKYISDPTYRMEFGRTLITSGTIEDTILRVTVRAVPESDKSSLLATSWFMEQWLCRLEAARDGWLSEFGVVPHFDYTLNVDVWIKWMASAG